MAPQQMTDAQAMFLLLATALSLPVHSMLHLPLRRCQHRTPRTALHQLNKAARASPACPLDVMMVGCEPPRPLFSGFFPGAPLLRAPRAPPGSTVCTPLPPPRPVAPIVAACVLPTAARNSQPRCTMPPCLSPHPFPHPVPTAHVVVCGAGAPRPRPQRRRASSCAPLIDR